MLHSWYIFDMCANDLPDIQYQIPLESPPLVVQSGFSVHGANPVERYMLQDLWCLHLYRYNATVKVNDDVLPIRPGFVGVIPSRTPMEYRFHGRSEHIYFHFRVIGQISESSPAIPAMTDTGDDFGRMYASLAEVVGAYDVFAQARLWDILWQIVRCRQPVGISQRLVHPAVRKTVAQIDQMLSEPIVVSQLANESGISPSHLGRLFQEELGQTVVSYIRDRRVRRAEHLLQHSTLPIKIIAVMVGLPDLQHFNKTIHQSLGKSPTRVRAEATVNLSEKVL